MCTQIWLSEVLCLAELSYAPASMLGPTVASLESDLVASSQLALCWMCDSPWTGCVQRI